MSELYSDSIFWIEVEKIKPNPYQPRLEFDEHKLRDLADSIRQYGVLQPLVVTRREVTKSDGGIAVEYELIAGERRLRASKIAGVSQVPAIIRTGEDNNKMKLELAIIENLQREDLNPVDRAKAFQKFIDEFGLKHVEIAKKVGKSREYVSNSLRLLMLPQDMLQSLAAGQMSEGHARALMMLKDRPEEQMTVFKEIVYKKLTVRETERIARNIAKDKVRRRDREYDPEIVRMEEELTEKLGTRVHIESREVGGKITIDFFSDDDLRKLLEYINENREEGAEKPSDLMQKIADSTPMTPVQESRTESPVNEEEGDVDTRHNTQAHTEADQRNEQHHRQEMLTSAKPMSVETIDEVVPDASTNVDSGDHTHAHYNASLPPAPLAMVTDDMDVDATQNTSASEAEDSRYPEYDDVPQAVTDPFDSLIETGDTGDAHTDNEKPVKNSDDDNIYSVKNFSI